MHKIAIINGPNLNLLGKREPSLYGEQAFEPFLEELRRRYAGTAEITCFQSNHEGDLIDRIQADGFRSDGIILNAGGYTHTSIALRDAVSAVPAPVAEVHLTDINTREPFRRLSYLTDVCCITIMGKGLQGYEEALRHLIRLPKL
ncbi:MAG: 3-dehydroquinate dehydratase [Paludibacteraceae bacterium]|nr:3-dehydroquinate dehydratase [Paludibacteraceae bacterium]